MYKKDSDYALNKRSSNIVYRFADGTCQEISLEDCLDFERWKALSDEDLRELDLQDQRAARGRFSLNDLTDISLNSLSAEEAADCDVPLLPDFRSVENAMIILKCLTETQRRRYLLHVFDGLTMRQIATQEKVTPIAIQHSVAIAKKKICERYSRFLKNGLTKHLQNDA